MIFLAALAFAIAIFVHLISYSHGVVNQDLFALTGFFCLAAPPNGKGPPRLRARSCSNRVRRRGSQSADRPVGASSGDQHLFPVEQKFERGAWEYRACPHVAVHTPNSRPKSSANDRRLLALKL